MSEALSHHAQIEPLEESGWDLVKVSPTGAAACATDLIKSLDLMTQVRRPGRQHLECVVVCCYPGNYALSEHDSTERQVTTGSLCLGFPGLSPLRLFSSLNLICISLL